MNEEEAFSKLVKYCTYQERCHSEVRTKLLSLKVYGQELENVMARLIEHDFLNEERYAKTYAGGKFRQNQWGKIKILQHFKFHKISDYCIREAMKEIPEDDYMKTLRNLAEKRKKQVSGDKNALQKTAQFLISRGFEPELVWKIIRAESESGE
jgi:regulatory protein